MLAFFRLCIWPKCLSALKSQALTQRATACQAMAFRADLSRLLASLELFSAVVYSGGTRSDAHSLTMRLSTLDASPPTPGLHRSFSACTASGLG